MKMRVCICLLSIACLALLGTGCVSKGKAQLREREAFVSGQQQALSQTQRTISGIQVIGEVQNSHVPYREGLTLAEAILAAEYRGFRDPREIVIDRNGQMISVNPKALLRGEDELLENGDRIILR